MTKAPDRHLLACMEVLYRAIIEARVLAWGGHRLRHRLSGQRDRQIADLMDAIHNIPLLAMNWDVCDQQMLRSYLVAYDETWAHRGSSLVKTYDAVLATGDAWVGKVEASDK